MKMDTKHPDTKIILSENFRSRQEVMDHGFQVVGSALRFNGDGVTFTGASGNRLYLPACPSASILMNQFSCNMVFTPGWNSSSTAGNTFFEQDGNIGYCSYYPTIDMYCSHPGYGYRIATSATNVKTYLRYGQKNYLSYLISNGSQKLWLNGTQIASTTTAGIMPYSGSNVLKGLVIGSSSAAAGYANPVNGTIHNLQWLNTTMTIEDHLDFMHNDTYSEIF